MWRNDSPARRGWLGALVFVVMLGVGCGEAKAPDAERPALDLVLGDDFVEVPRQLSSEQRTKVARKLDGVVSPTEKTFYLAIRRSELQHRWFLSAKLRESMDEPTTAVLPVSLGLQVIRFREQNGKLYLFDARDGLERGDTFKPDLMVEAYPIVTDHAAFNRLPGADQYVLVDPAAGLNRFGIIGDSYIGAASIDFSLELLFSQRFRRIADGVQFEQVFMGYATIPGLNGAGETPESNDFRLAGTLSLALRKYQEGEGFTPMRPPESSHFFLSAGRFVPNTDEVERFVTRWNLHPGMKPIRWYITPSFLSLKEDPRYQEMDVVGAVRRGIEGWNQAFGFKVFEAVMADDTMDIGDADKNFAIFDRTSTVNASAEFLANPNTGEMRGAWTLLTAGFIDDAEAFYSGTQAERASLVALDTRPTPRRLTWAGRSGESGCSLMRDEVPLGASFREELLAERRGETPLAPWKKVEGLITQVMLHEVGHALGLRHNFSGSRAYDGTPGSPRSSSVMEYPNKVDAYHITEPGTYDVAAMRYLHGLSAELPTDLFCTDPVGRNYDDPNCGLYDRYDAPLSRWYTPTMRALVEQALRGGPANRDLGFNLFWMDGYVRNGDPGEQRDAYAVLMEQVRPPLHVPQGQGAEYAARADALARRFLSFLYLDPRNAGRREYVDLHQAHPIPATPEYTAALLADVRGILLNVDGVRGFPTRRVMVSVLKAHQTLAAYGVLQEVHEELTARLPTLGGEERLGTKELLGRIEVASTPYFR